MRIRPRASVALPTWRRRILGALALVATSGFAATASAAQGGLPNVAVLAADPYTPEVPPRLQATGLFGVVDTIDANGMTPTLVQLQAYDAILTWSNSDYLNSTALGDVLADYVDAGGGVVVATFANCETQANRYLQGRWLTGGYGVIVPQGGVQQGTASMGTVHVPTHPVMAGVTNFHGGSTAWRPATLALTTGSVLIAAWSDGKTLVAEHGVIPGRVDLGFFPPSQSAHPGSWQLATDGTLLTANALLHAGGATGSGTPYCLGDGSGTACPCGNSGLPGNGCASSLNASGANLAAGGTPSLATDTLVLSGSGMPNSSALYFQGLTQIQGGLGAVFGDGLRCVGGTVRRLKTATNVAGASQYPGPGDPSISVRGLVTAPGTRTYQVWYRNAAAFCTPSTFNVSNGIEVAWVN